MKNGRYNISIHSDTHAEAKHLARSLGVSLSAVIEQQLKRFVTEQRALFDATHPPLKAGDSLKHARQRRYAINRELARMEGRHDPIWRAMEHTRKSLPYNRVII